MSMRLSDYGYYRTEYDPSRIRSVSSDKDSIGTADAASPSKTSEAQGTGTTQQSQASSDVKENFQIDSSDSPKASRTADIDNVSVTFNKNDSFGYIGSDKDISKLDESQNVSGKQKNGILNDYLYYVGSSDNGNSQSPQQVTEDGTIILKGRLEPRL